jgi:hypothetical protein
MMDISCGIVESQKSEEKFFTHKGDELNQKSRRKAPGND